MSALYSYSFTAVGGTNQPAFGGGESLGGSPYACFCTCVQYTALHVFVYFIVFLKFTAVR